MVRSSQSHNSEFGSITPVESEFRGPPLGESSITAFVRESEHPPEDSPRESTAVAGEWNGCEMPDSGIYRNHDCRGFILA